MTEVRDAQDIDWTKLVRPGDRIVIGQTNAEPEPLLRSLVAARANLGRPRLFLGPVAGTALSPEHGDHLAFESYCGTGINRSFVSAGVMDLVPCHFTDLARNFESGHFGADIVLVMLGERSGRFNAGISRDHMVAAARRARVIIAEVSDAVPWTQGGDWPEDLTPHLILRSQRAPLPLDSGPGGETEQRIAAHIAPLIPDGATLELGIGALPSLVLAALDGHRDLGYHSGVIGDAAVAAIAQGVITNARKPIDRGISVAGMLFGGQKTLDFAHENPAFRLEPTSYTHNPAVTCNLPLFHAINGAIEVDLTGQVNSEVAGGRYIGAVGGQADFARCAAASPGGRAIIALASTARGGSISAITPALTSGTVSLSRADVDTVVTEWGVAELRGIPLRQRILRMIAIAHPDHREALERAGHELSRNL